MACAAARDRAPSRRRRRVAIDAEHRVCLLRQYRHAAGGYIYELPAGKLEPDEPPEATARRELVEEGAVQRRSLDLAGRVLQLARGVHRGHPPVSRHRAHAGHRRARGGRGFPGGMVAAGAGRRARPRRGTHRCEDGHRHSAGRSSFKNCVKRLTSCDSRPPECWLCQTTGTARRSYFGRDRQQFKRQPASATATGAVFLRSCTTIVVTRAWNG